MPELYEPIIIIRPENVHIAETARVDSFTKIEGGLGVHIGEYVHIASLCHINIGGGEVILDDYSAVASGGKIIGGSAQLDGISLSAVAPKHMQVVKRSRTVIGKYAVVLTNAVVLPGVTLGEGAILAACALATKDIPPYEVWGGVPARKIGERQRPMTVNVQGDVAAK